ncbi:MAG TPA: sialidase family protein [Methylomirabilota bacterium]|nr:sialidase family protein [Methylomirabilota bacterium]
MKKREMQRYQKAAVAALVWFAVISGCSKQEAKKETATPSAATAAATLQFEPHPQTLSVPGDPGAATRHPKIGGDNVASSVIHFLTVLGEGDNSRLALLNSNDSGDTFEKPVWVSEKGAKFSSHGENSPALLITPEVTYAAWNQGGDIRLSRSMNWGASFEKPVRISDKPEKDYSGYVSIGVAPNGDVYAVWLDTRDREDGHEVYSLYLARSKDHGATFGKNVRVAAHVCECCRPNVSFGPNGEVLAFWRHIYPGNVRDMTVAVSRDNGETFSAPVRIAEDNWKLEGCPDSGVAVARTGDRVYAAWLTEASPTRSGVRMTWSDDAGKTWAAPVMASQKTLDANYPAMSVADDGRVEMVFQGRNPEKEKGWAPTTAFVVEIGKDGGLSTPLEVPGIAAAVSRPTVYTGINGRVFVGWTEVKEGKGTAKYARGRRM